MSSNLPNFPEESAAADRESWGSTQQRPPAMDTAVLLMRIGAALSLVGLLVGLVTLGSLKDQIEDDLGASASQSDIDAAYGVGIAFVVIVGLIGVALWLWMASTNGKGKKWARIVATVFGVINVLSFVYTLTAGTTPALSLIVSALTLIVGVAALFFMYKPESSAFYQANSRR